MQDRNARGAWGRGWGCAAIVLWLLAGCSSGDKAPIAAAVASMTAAAPGNGNCPLSLAQQRRAVADFHKMMPAIAHVRCANCHGGIDVFAPSAAQLHVGGQIDMKCSLDTEAEAMGLGDGKPVCQEDFSTCQDCHDDAPGWQLPQEAIFFAGRSPVQICNQFRTRDGVGVFRKHVTDDALVLAGFKGQRGHSDLKPEPPPISHAQFQAAALDWLSLVSRDNHWLGGQDCGCVASVPRLRITDHLVDSSDRYGVERDLTYRADLTLDENGDDFSGSGTYSGVLVTRKLNCNNGEPEDRKMHHLQGSFDATASYRETGGGKGMVNYNFDTLDWPVELVPFAMMGVAEGGKAAADAIDMAHHMGATMGLMLETTGPKTVIHTHKVDDGRGSHMAGCVQSASHDEDITIEIIANRMQP